MKLLISTLFIVFSINCIGAEAEKLGKQEVVTEIYSISNIDNDKKYWSDIEGVINNKFENEQFEVKQQLISIDKLTKIILSFINGTESPCYIVIGVAEGSDSIYRIINKNEFDQRNHLKEDGIYKVTGFIIIKRNLLINTIK